MRCECPDPEACPARSCKFAALVGGIIPDNQQICSPRSILCEASGSYSAADMAICIASSEALNTQSKPQFRVAIGCRSESLNIAATVVVRAALLSPRRCGPRNTSTVAPLNANTADLAVLQKKAKPRILVPGRCPQRRRLRDRSRRIRRSPLCDYRKGGQPKWIQRTVFREVDYEPRESHCISHFSLCPLAIRA